VIFFLRTFFLKKYQFIRKEGTEMQFQNGENFTASTKLRCSAVIIFDEVFIDNEKVQLYGIRVFFGTVIAAEYADITDDCEKIKELCALFNNNDIDIKHIHDIIEDFADSLHYV
jgi:hypothetical protein